MGNRGNKELPPGKDRYLQELEELKQLKEPKWVSLKTLIDSSDKFEEFAVKFPLQTTRMKTLQNDKTLTEKNINLEDLINSSYPVIHERLLPIMVKFIDHKKLYGTGKERKIYKNMTVIRLVDRLLLKRSMVFCNSNDIFILFDGTEGAGGFENIGTKNEDPKFSIEKFMTYDEIKIAALLSISARSVFINNGARDNFGRIGVTGSFEQDGIILGQVGPRFQRPQYMEYKDCLITKKQNQTDNGYGPSPSNKNRILKDWAELWGTEYMPTWDEACDSQSTMNLLELSKHMMLNVSTYKSRIRMSAEIMLAEAKTRASVFNKKAYVHVVGLGLGVWQISHFQHQIYVDTWGDALENHNYEISTVHFSWIPVEQCKGTINGEKLPGTDVTIFFSKRNMHDSIPEDNFLICHYAWDGNSLPGNEYWVRSLSSSADPAAACSSCIAELHNPYINPCIRAENLHIATADGVVHVKEYASKKLTELMDVK